MKLLVTTDGSARSLVALPHAASLARATGSTITLVRVLDQFMDLGKHLAVKLDDAAALATAEWEASLAAALRSAGVEGDLLVAKKVHGEETWDTILRAASEQGASLIAMDSRGTGAIRHALLGSVAMGLLGRTKLPVMVTGPRIQPTVNPTASPADGYHVVATSDGSPASLAVLRALRPLAESTGLTVTLLRLCWPAARHSAEDCAAQLRSFRSELPASARVTEVVREMTLTDGAAPAIVAVAGELGASAIAIATHGHSAAYHLFGGSTALGVVSQSSVPVILARSLKPG